MFRTNSGDALAPSPLTVATLSVVFKFLLSTYSYVIVMILQATACMVCQLAMATWTQWAMAAACLGTMVTMERTAWTRYGSRCPAQCGYATLPRPYTEQLLGMEPTVWDSKLMSYACHGRYVLKICGGGCIPRSSFKIEPPRMVCRCPRGACCKTWALVTMAMAWPAMAMASQDTVKLAMVNQDMGQASLGHMEWCALIYPLRSACYLSIAMSSIQCCCILVY